MRQMRATYYGMMTEIDDYLGRVFAYLDETGQWRDTLVVFTSDHGEQLGDHHLLGKIGYHDESFRIPLVVVDPAATTTRGQIVDAPTESVDLMPTMLELGRRGDPRTPATAARCCRSCTATARPIGATRCTTSSISATCRTARRRRSWGSSMDECALCVLQDARLQIRPFRRAAAAAVRPARRSATSSATSPTIPPTPRVVARLRAADAVLADAPRRPHAHPLPRHPAGPGTPRQPHGDPTHGKHPTPPPADGDCRRRRAAALRHRPVRQRPTITVAVQKVSQQQHAGQPARAVQRRHAHDAALLRAAGRPELAGPAGERPGPGDRSGAASTTGRWSSRCARA